MAGLTPNQKQEKLKKSKAIFEEAIKKMENPDFLFVSMYDNYCKALEGAETAYQFLTKHGRYYFVLDKDGNNVPRSNPANADFLKYMQQSNNLCKTLTDMLKKTVTDGGEASCDL